MAVNLFASVIKVTPYHVTLLMGGATVIRDGLGKSALCVSTICDKFLSKLIKAVKYSSIISYNLFKEKATDLTSSVAGFTC